MWPVCSGCSHGCPPAVTSDVWCPHEYSFTYSHVSPASRGSNSFRYFYTLYLNFSTAPKFIPRWRKGEKTVYWVMKSIRLIQGIKCRYFIFFMGTCPAIGGERDAKYIISLQFDQFISNQRTHAPRRSRSSLLLKPIESLITRLIRLKSPA